MIEAALFGVFFAAAGGTVINATLTEAQKRAAESAKQQQRRREKHGVVYLYTLPRAVVHGKVLDITADVECDAAEALIRAAGVPAIATQIVELQNATLSPSGALPHIALDGESASGYDEVARFIAERFSPAGTPSHAVTAPPSKASTRVVEEEDARLRSAVAHATPFLTVPGRDAAHKAHLSVKSAPESTTTECADSEVINEGALLSDIKMLSAGTAGEHSLASTALVNAWLRCVAEACPAAAPREAAHAALAHAPSSTASSAAAVTP